MAKNQVIVNAHTSKNRLIVLPINYIMHIFNTYYNRIISLKIRKFDYKL